MPTETKKEVYTVSEVSQKLGISRNLAYRLCRDKQLPGVIHLGKWRMMISAAVIDKLLAGDNYKG